MAEQTGSGIGGAAAAEQRFDGETVRRILERAVEEQYRLSNTLADSYSLEELQEMAAEARISPEALRAAIDEHDAPASATALAAGAKAERPRGGLSASWIPGRSPAVKRAVLASTGGIAFLGLLLAFPAFAEMLFWAALLSLLVLSVLVLLGASPF